VNARTKDPDVVLTVCRSRRPVFYVYTVQLRYVNSFDTNTTVWI